MIEDKEVYRKVLVRKGTDHQLKKLSQELLELGLALSYMEEGRNDHNVHEELADVRILLRQIIPLFNENGAVDKWHKLKIERLNERVDSKGEMLNGNQQRPIERVNH